MSKSKLLERTTEETMRKLEGEGVILPSQYFETFVQTARKYGEGIASIDGKSSVDEALAQVHALERDLLPMEGVLQEELESLRERVAELGEDLYMDPACGSFTRTWFFREYLGKEMRFKTDGTVFLVHFKAYSRIFEEYGESTALALLGEICSNINKYISQSLPDGALVRFRSDRFLILVPPMHRSRSSGIRKELSLYLEEQRYRHRRRRFDLQFTVWSENFVKGEPFPTLLDRLEGGVFESH